MAVPETSTTPGPVPAGVRSEFLDAMSSAATGVTVVATDGRAGRFAQTVSAMCSVSDDPATLLVCVNLRSPINDAIATHEAFAVSVLGKQHDHVADTFAGRPWPGKDRWDFTCGEWEDSEQGLPRLADAIASFDCAVFDTIDVGTHRVYVGRVRSVTTNPGVPLVYSERDYAEPHVFPHSTFPDFPGTGPVHRTRKGKA